MCCSLIQRPLCVGLQARISAGAELTHVTDSSDLIIEAIIENLDIKLVRFDHFWIIFDQLLRSKSVLLIKLIKFIIEAIIENLDIKLVRFDNLCSVAAF